MPVADQIGGNFMLTTDSEKLTGDEGDNDGFPGPPIVDEWTGYVQGRQLRSVMDEESR